MLRDSLEPHGDAEAVCWPGALAIPTAWAKYGPAFRLSAIRTLRKAGFTYHWVLLGILEGCWLCEPGRNGYQRGGGPHPVLSACRDLHPCGRRETSPQSSRVLLSNPPVLTVSSFTPEQVQVPSTWLTFLSSADTQGCLGGHPVGNRWLLVPVPGPRASLTLLHGSRSESGTRACYPPSPEEGQ